MGLEDKALAQNTYSPPLFTHKWGIRFKSSALFDIKISKPIQNILSEGFEEKK